MKRRGFLGFLGGAVAVGPATAKAAVAELPKGLGAIGPMPPMGGFYGNTISQAVDGGDWRLKEIASLKRFLSGELTDEEKEQEKRRRLNFVYNSINQNVAGLQSVSGVHKMRMFDEQMCRLNARIERSERKGYLARLLREAAQ